MFVIQMQRRLASAFAEAVLDRNLGIKWLFSLMVCPI